MARDICFACNKSMELQKCWGCGGSGKSVVDGGVDDCEICYGRGEWNACVNLACTMYDARLITERIPPAEDEE